MRESQLSNENHSKCQLNFSLDRILWRQGYHVISLGIDYMVFSDEDSSGGKLTFARVAHFHDSSLTR